MAATHHERQHRSEFRAIESLARRIVGLLGQDGNVALWIASLRRAAYVLEHQGGRHRRAARQVLDVSNESCTRRGG